MIPGRHVWILALLLATAGCWQPAPGGHEQTMSDLRAIGASAEAYAADHRVYPAAYTIDDLACVLEPTYSRKLPRIDAWNEPFRYEVRTRIDGKQSYRIASASTDGAWEQTDLWRYARGTTTGLDSDIVFGDGEFIRWPE